MKKIQNTTSYISSHFLVYSSAITLFSLVYLEYPRQQTTGLWHLVFLSALRKCASYTFGVKTSFLQVIYLVTLIFPVPHQDIHYPPFIISYYFRICFSIAYWCLIYSLSLMSPQFEYKLHERSKFLCICSLSEPNV